MRLENNSSSDGSIAYLSMLTAVAALGGLLFGYDTAVVSGAIGFMETRFNLGEWVEGWAAGCALVGCMFGAGFAGMLSDRFGRKKILVLSAVLFVISALGAAFPRNLTEFVVARILGGLGIGMASMMSPLYIAEVSPARLRGRLVSVNQFAIVSGMLVVYFVNAMIARAGDEAWNVAVGWRWMFGSGVFPAALFLLLLLVVPESPRWLLKQGRNEEARTILTRVGGPEHAAAEVTAIRDTLADESGSLRQLLEPGMRLPLTVGIILAILQQITGINIVLYYGPEIFKSAGTGVTQAIGYTVLVGLVNLIFTIVAIAVVDRFGRKPLLMLASAGMGISLVMLGRAFAEPGGSGVLIWMLVYVAAFAVAMGPVVWVVIAEIFPTRIRGRAMSIATVCLWASCYLVTQFFLPLLKQMEGGVFYIFAFMCVVALVFVGWAVPETKGKSLEEIERGWRRPEGARRAQT